MRHIWRSSATLMFCVSRNSPPWRHRTHSSKGGSFFHRIVHKVHIFPTLSWVAPLTKYPISLFCILTNIGKSSIQWKKVLFLKFDFSHSLIKNYTFKITKLVHDCCTSVSSIQRVKRDISSLPSNTTPWMCKYEMIQKVCTGILSVYSYTYASMYLGGNINFRNLRNTLRYQHFKRGSNNTPKATIEEHLSSIF